MELNNVIAACILAVRVGLLGWLWEPRPAASSTERDKTVLFDLLTFAGRAIPIGLVLNLLPALCFAQASIWSNTLDWVLWGSVALLGVLIRLKARSSFGACRLGILLVFLSTITLLVLLLPPRSEWIAGGWDPGLYQNYSVAVARTGGFSDITGTVYEKLHVDERALLGPEAFPGVPLDQSSGVIRYYFFQLMPFCGALFYRIGGFDLLVRINQVIALFGLPVLAAFLLNLGLRGGRLAWVVALWCVSPLWWYQQAVPTTEMLQLLLLLGAMTLYMDAMDKRSGRPVWAAVLLCAVGVNHFGFPALVAIMLLVVSVAESRAECTGRRGRLIVCGIGLAAGLVWDLIFSQVTLLHLQVKDQAVTLVLAVFGVSLISALILSSSKVKRVLSSRVAFAFKWGGTLLGALIVAVSVSTCSASVGDLIQRFGPHPSLLAGALIRFKGICEFMDPLWPYLLGLGVIGVSCSSVQSDHRIKTVTCALGGVALMLVLNPGIAPFYPWALRRYFVYLLPASCLAVGCGLAAYPSWIFSGSRAKFRNAVTVSAAAAVILVGAYASRDAIRVGDYVGYREILESIDEQINEDDIVIADDSRIGTPLLLSYGRNVLNGEMLWKSKDADYKAEFMSMVRQLLKNGHARVLWLTSTDRGLELYGQDDLQARQILLQIDGSYKTVIHSSRADRFAVRENKRPFRLYVQARSL